jgi:hypothetical protein
MTTVSNKEIELFKEILDETKRKDLYRRILKETEEEETENTLRAYRQNQAAAAYNKGSSNINRPVDNNEQQVDISIGNKNDEHLTTANRKNIPQKNEKDFDSILNDEIKRNS